MEEMLNILVSKGQLTASQEKMFQGLLLGKRISFSEWLVTQIQSELIFGAFSSIDEKESVRAIKKISELAKVERSADGNPTIYSDESIEDIVFLLDYLESNNGGTSTFFVNCKSRLIQKKSLSIAQIEKLVLSAEKYTKIIRSTPSLLIGFNELQRKLQIDYDPTGATSELDSSELF